MRLKLLIMLGLMIRIGFLKSTKNIYGYPLVRWRFSRYEIQHDLVYFEKPCKTSPFLMTPECKLKVLCINNIYTHTSTTLRCEWWEWRRSKRVAVLTKLAENNIIYSTPLLDAETYDSSIFLKGTRWNNMHHCLTTLSEATKLPQVWQHLHFQLSAS